MAEKRAKPEEIAVYLWIGASIQLPSRFVSDASYEQQRYLRFFRNVLGSKGKVFG